MANPAENTKPNPAHVPMVAMVEMGIAFHRGGHEPFNWRDKDKGPSYLGHAGKALRHIYEAIEGPDREGSGKHHLGAAMANLAVILDAQAHGTIVDDRPKRNTP